MSNLEQIRERLAAVTDQGMLPWRRVKTSDGAGTGVIDNAGSVIGYGTGIAAADLLANAPADIAHLLATIGDVLVISDIGMNSEHGDPAFILGWEAALEEVKARIETVGKES